jgi:8-oxo-dGTP pyrophosphatase MutT (NUDIX family)
MDLIPAAIVITLRQASPSPQVLLVRRNPALEVQGGAWAFPGGRVSKQDGSLEGSQALVTARACAVREMKEETNLAFEPHDLILLTRWVTPVELDKRFYTWIFISAGNNGKVKVDGREIIAHRWCAAQQALELHDGGAMQLTPPAYVILANLGRIADIEAMMDSSAGQIPDSFEGRLVDLRDGRCAIYREDAGYADKSLDSDGPRHRLWMRASGWLYEHQFRP